MTVYAPYPSMYVWIAAQTRTRSPRLIYMDMLGPRHATFTLNNAEGRRDCFCFANKMDDI